jgi:tetratricopeptide (TPR) repeat protein
MCKTPRAALLVGFLLLSNFVHSESSSSEQELQAGLAAYQKANFAEAIQHLERAVQLNPGSMESHLALADAYSAQYIESPNTEGMPNAAEFTAANDRLIYRAVEQYKAVVTIQPSNTRALNNVGHIYYQRAKFSDAEVYFRQSLKVDPTDKEALYSLAVLNWTRSYQFRMERRNKLHLKSDMPLITFNACAAVRSKNLERVEEGILLLTRLSAISNFAEVPAWLSLLYRERAEIQCGDQAAYRSDLKSASDSVQLACTARASHAERVPNQWPPAPAPAPHDESCAR